MLEFLYRPYPFSFQPTRRVKQILPIGIIVFSFLVLFKPFGIANMPDYILFSACMSFSGGIAGLITTVIIPYFFPGYFDEAKWTLKRNIAWSACINFFFATFMFISFNLYRLIVHDERSSFTFSTYLWWVYLNLIFGLPLGIIINLVNQYYLLKKHLRIANHINQSIVTENQHFSDNLLKFEIDRYKKVQFDVDKLIYVEALGNYVNIFYLDEGIQKITIRETITNLEKQIGKSDFIYKPHRSYLVNMQHIKNITGDAQGLKIHFSGMENVVPVSRNKIKAFRELMSLK